jgi:DNA modification methylase
MQPTNISTNKLKTNPNNPRAIRKDQLDKLVKSLREFPEMLEARPIVVDPDFVVLGGNMRLKAAQLAGLTEVPVYVASWEEAKHKEFIIKDNLAFGEWDWDMLANEWDAEELDDWGLDVPLEDEPTEGLTDPDEVPEIPEEPTTKPGDLWILGEHRLLCGDSTKAEDVERLMDGKKADMVFTDPPYGVNIKGGANQINSIAGDITQTAIPFSFELAVENATNEKGRLYFCGGEGNIHLYQKLFERYCRQLPRHLIWVKESFVMKPNGYHNQYEFIFHGFKAGGGSLESWFGGRTEHEASDVWQLKRDNRNDYLHPTQKPVELPARAITNSSPVNGIVYEPFGGSGSTLIAAEKTGRKCYGMELDPKYCDVIVKRWEDFTGKKAELWKQ